ncbi:uncharacterized protein LOC130897190 [Diorhabda carinulata]|uniref:uncharacterized protein LOC130897190 n=1 Tax=Diorhabda carinulata TaxID=1163345 RepID=UPI0025A236D3|nr:uncharacterized protein LOC130897190 [Diorhabda carinulata]
MRYRLNLIVIVFIIILKVICCEEDVNDENSTENSAREMREFEQFGWRTIDTFHDSDSGWIPRGENRSPDQIRPKRRRLRKRKRRPPMVDNPDERIQFIRRRIRPYRLDPWEEINEEDIKPIIRRRKPQRFQSSEEINETKIYTDEKVTTKMPLEDLKNMLKQPEVKVTLTEAISELLNGNEKSTTIESVIYRRLPILKKENVVEETAEDQKRIKFDDVTEETTERRLFVTNSTKIEEEDYINELKRSTTPRIIRTRQKLPTTNAKLRSTTKSVIETPIPEPVKINISEVIENIENTTKTYTTQGPMRISIDLDTIFDTNLESNTSETYVTAKEELKEVMEDPISRDKLSKILEIRNMTLGELVEQRERGSSQLHLADIFHNNTREPEPEEEPLVGHINFIANRREKSLNIDLTTTSESVETFPWKQLYPDLFHESNDVDEILKRYDSNDEGFFLNIPAGMKSALFVSLAIIGLSIVVFLAILVVFKMLQKKRKSLKYCRSLTTKFKPPMLIQGPPTTAIRTFMNETLGRKKNYYKRNLQSMSDEIWDTSKERKESF